MLVRSSITLRRSHLLHTLCCYFLPLSMPVRTRSFFGVATPLKRSLIPATTAANRQISATNVEDAELPFPTGVPETPKKRTRFSNNSAVVTPSPVEVVLDSTTSPSVLEEKSVKTKPPRRKKQKRSVTPKTFEPPQDWRVIYSLVEELRKDRTAPCDHSGCEALADNGATPKTARFQILLSLMLSSQTKDAVVGEAIRRMQHDGVANIEAIATMTPETLDAYISKVGFHNNKNQIHSSGG